MSQDQLKPRAETLEEKAEKYERRSDIESQVEVAENNVQNLNKRLLQLKNRLERLQFLTEVAVIVDAFDHPREKGYVEDAYNQASRLVDISDEDLVDKVVDEEIEQFQQRVNQAVSNVEQAIEKVDQELDSVQERWTDRTDSARQVLEIASSSRSLETTLDRIDTFVTKRMWNSDNSLNKLQSDWQGYTTKWEKEGVEWGEFQDEHGLSDSTVKYLQRFSKGESFTLADLPDQVLKDITSVDDLQQALTVRL